MNIINKIRKVFWLEPSQAKLIKRQAKIQKVTESALVRHIITQWFKK